MQHHLVKICIEHRNTLNLQQVAAVNCSDQPIYALSRIIQRKYREFTFSKYFILSLYIKKELLIANGHLVAGTRPEDILGVVSIYRDGLQTATLNVNHIHKARHCVQLFVVTIYICLKKAHKKLIQYCYYILGRKNIIHLVVCLSIGC